MSDSPTKPPTKKKGLLARFPVMGWNTIGAAAIPLIQVFLTHEVTLPAGIAAIVMLLTGVKGTTKASPAYKVTEAAEMAATQTVAHVNPDAILPISGLPNTEAQTIVNTVMDQVTSAFNAPTVTSGRRSRRH